MSTCEPGHTDRTEILERLAGLAAALDAKDWASFDTFFLPEAVAYRATGRAAIGARVQGHLGGAGPTHHLLGNHRVTFGAGTARSQTYVRVHHVGAGTMAGHFYECLGQYNDAWVKTPEGWKISERVIDVWIQMGDIAVLQPAP